MKARFVGCALALVVGSAAVVSRGDVVTLQNNYFQPGGFIGLTGGLSVTKDLQGETGTSTIVGAFGWTVTSSNSPSFAVNSNLFSYCLQKSQPFNAGETYSFLVNPTVTGSPLGGVDAGYIDRTAALQLQGLVTGHWNESLTSNYKAAAFQLAVWEIEYDAGADTNTNDPNPPEILGSANSDFYFTHGIIQATSINSDGALAISQATEWLSQLSTIPTSITTAMALNNGSPPPEDAEHMNIQDQLVQVVPVPATLPVGLAMFASMFAVRKYRRRS